MMFKNNELGEEKGSAAIETALTLPLFCIVVALVLTLLTAIRAETVIQHAADQMAKEFSKFAYAADMAYTVSVTSEGETVDAALTAYTQFSDMTHISAEENGYNGYQLMKNAMTGYTDGSYASVKKNAAAFAREFGGYMVSPEGVSTAIAAILHGNMSTGADKAVGLALCNTLASEYIRFDAEDADRLLRSCGIVGGVKGLDFSLSEILEDGQTVKIAVTYTLQPVFFKLIGLKPVCYKSAKTIAWRGAAYMN